MDDLFPETVESAKTELTLDSVMERLHAYLKKPNKADVYPISIGFTPDGSWAEIRYSNGNKRCFPRLKQAIKELNKEIPIPVR